MRKQAESAERRLPLLVGSRNAHARKLARRVLDRSALALDVCFAGQREVGALGRGGDGLREPAGKLRGFIYLRAIANKFLQAVKQNKNKSIHLWAVADNLPARTRRERRRPERTSGWIPKPSKSPRTRRIPRTAYVAGAPHTRAAIVSKLFATAHK
eukprot:SAG31_NODE_1293_length_8955_cov_100.938911_6_plen_156_part_00